MEKYRVITWNRVKETYTIYCYSACYAEAVNTVLFLRRNFPDCITYAVKADLLEEMLPLLIEARKKVTK